MRNRRNEWRSRRGVLAQSSALLDLDFQQAFYESLAYIPWSQCTSRSVEVLHVHTSLLAILRSPELALVLQTPQHMQSLGAPTASFAPAWPRPQTQAASIPQPSRKHRVQSAARCVGLPAEMTDCIAHLRLCFTSSRA
eukprot:3707714-Amphidinium_carterae.1